MVLPIDAFGSPGRPVRRGGSLSPLELIVPTHMTNAYQLTWDTHTQSTKTEPTKVRLRRSLELEDKREMYFTALTFEQERVISELDYQVPFIKYTCW